MKKACVIGLGRSGIAASRLLAQQGWQVELSDRGSSENLQQQQQQLANPNITVKLGHQFSVNPEAPPELVVISPGVPWDIPPLLEARSLGIDTIGEMELAWRSLKEIPWVAITGTNGKTTTTALVSAIFKAAGLNAPACGNIGYAACEIALKHARGEAAPDWIVAEVSSYQCESSRELAPEIGLWTTFTPDHLSRHKTLENYYEIKASLLRRCQTAIFNGDDPYLRKLGRKAWLEAVWTSIEGQEKLVCELERGVYLDSDGWLVAFGDRIIPVNLLTMVGAHNRQNLLLAVAAAKLAGVENEEIARAIKSFPGVPHRLEFICTHAGADFINDSKATNYDAAEVGLRSVTAPAILIAGGEAKDGDDRAWLAAIQAKAARVLLIGAAAPAFSQRLQEVGYSDWEIVETLENAATRAAELAPELNARVVLLSPACASFDQYRSFEHRGDSFRELCEQLGNC